MRGRRLVALFLLGFAPGAAASAEPRSIVAGPVLAGSGVDLNGRIRHLARFATKRELGGVDLDGRRVVWAVDCVTSVRYEGGTIGPGYTFETGAFTIWLEDIVAAARPRAVVHVPFEDRPA